MFTRFQPLAADYVKSHARMIAEVMTRKVVSAGPDAPISDVAALMEKHSVKRAPIIEAGRVVGIVSRANLVQAVAAYGVGPEIPLSDIAIRDALTHEWMVLDERRAANDVRASPLDGKIVKYRTIPRRISGDNPAGDL